MQPDVLTGACAPAAAAAADAHAAPAARSATFNTRLTADHLNGNLCIPCASWGPWAGAGPLLASGRATHMPLHTLPLAGDLIAQLGEAGSRSKFKHLHLHLLVKDCWQHIALECSPQGMQIEVRMGPARGCPAQRGQVPRPGRARPRSPHPRPAFLLQPKAVHSMVQLLGGREQEPIMWMLRSEHGDPDTLFGTVVHKSRRAPAWAAVGTRVGSSRGALGAVALAV